MFHSTRHPPTLQSAPADDEVEYGSDFLTFPPTPPNEPVLGFPPLVPVISPLLYEFRYLNYTHLLTSSIQLSLPLYNYSVVLMMMYISLPPDRGEAFRVWTRRWESFSRLSRLDTADQQTQHDVFISQGRWNRSGQSGHGRTNFRCTNVGVFLAICHTCTQAGTFFLALILPYHVPVHMSLYGTAQM